MSCQDDTQRRQCAKAQARKQARAFKSLDTTVHVLGIQAKQGEQEGHKAAAEGTRAAAKLHKVLSVASRYDTNRHDLKGLNFIRHKGRVQVTRHGMLNAWTICAVSNV